MLDWDPANAPSAPGPAEEIAGCDKYAAVGDSDGAEGTKSGPFRTTQRLVDHLQSGQARCLRVGTYMEGATRYSCSRNAARRSLEFLWVSPKAI